MSESGKGVLERPDAFSRLAELDEKELDRVLDDLEDP